jgi:tetratricopeptide (TPR) repeat protein
LRVYSDTRGAQDAFSAAQAGSPEDHQTEERGAQDIARAYQALLNGRGDDAIRGLSQVLERGDVTLAAEGNGAWAFVERYAGEVLSDSGGLDRALNRSKKAVEAERFRFDFVVDLAMLLARNRETKEAKEYLRTARALDGNAPDPDLVQAVVAIMEGQHNAMRSALQAARNKARDRGGLAVDAVRLFESKLSQATPPSHPQNPDATPSRTPRPPAGGNIIKGTSSAAITFSPGNNAIQAVLQVKADTQAVKLRISNADRGVRILARFGRQVQSVQEADYDVITADGDDVVLVLRRDAVEKPLRSGTYYVAFMHPKPTREIPCQLSTTFYTQGEQLPQVWKELEGGEISLGSASKAEADSLVAKFKAGQRAAAISGWEALEDKAKAPQLAIIRGQWLLIEKRYEDAFRAFEKVMTAEAAASHAHFVEYNLARCEYMLRRPITSKPACCSSTPT